MNLNNHQIIITRKKIKNLYLRVQSDGRITVSAPYRCSEKVIQDFISAKSDWIMTQLEKLEKRQDAESKYPLKVEFATGEYHYYWGLPCLLTVEETTGPGGVTFEKNSCLYMRVPKNSTVEQRKHLLEEFYREQLKLVVPDLMEHYAQIVGKMPAEWRIRSMKTRWGTCNVQDKRIWLSLNLAKKHPDCLHYVIVHELTHLHEPNHSKAFWARMDMYYPEWRTVRKLLKE